MLPFFSKRKKAKTLPLLLILTLAILTSCYIPSKEEPHSATIPEEVDWKPTQTTEPLETSSSTEEVEEEVEGESEVVIDLEKRIPIVEELVEDEIEDIPLERLPEGTYELVLETEHLSDWFRSFFKKIVVKECSSTCSIEEIEELLEPEDDEWVVVRHGRVLYTHSGWPLTQGPFFGEMFLRILKEGVLEESSICFDEMCFDIIDSITLSREEVGGRIPLSELFEIEQDDYFLVTCAKRITPGFQTPKLILQLSTE